MEDKTMKIMNQKKKKGFTLIELIVVIAILAILAAVAVPSFIGITTTARTAQENGAAAEFANAINIYNTSATTKITAKPATLDALITTLAAAKGGSLAPTISGDIIAANVLAKIVINADTGVATIAKTE